MKTVKSLFASFIALGLTAGALSASAATSLPAGYTAVDFIYSTGKQYIETTYEPNPKTWMEVDLKFVGTFKTSLGDMTANFFGSSGSGSSAYSINFGTNKDQAYTLFYWLNKGSAGGGKQGKATFTEALIKNRNTLRVCNGSSNSSVTLGGSTGTNYTAPEKRAMTSDVNLKLFGSSGGKPFGSYDNLCVYRWKIYESDDGTVGGANEKLVHDFVPAVNAGGVAGLYDLVGETFLTSKTSTQFAAPATYYMCGQDAAGESSLSSSSNGSGGIGWTINPAAAPTSSHTVSALNPYVIPIGTLVRTPQSGALTFKGDSLTLGGALALAYTSATTLTINNLIADGGQIGTWHTAATTLAGNISIPENKALDFCTAGDNTRKMTVSAKITGSGTIRLMGEDNTPSASGVTLTGDNSGFTGTIAVATVPPKNFTLDVQGNFGGTITSLPPLANTQAIKFNLSKLDAAKGLPVATTTIPEALKTKLTLSGAADASAADLPLITFPAGTEVNAADFTISNGSAAYANLAVLDGAGGTKVLVANHVDTPAGGGQPVLTSPANGATVALVTDYQKGWFNLTAEQRFFALSENASAPDPYKLTIASTTFSEGSPVVLAWTGTIGNATVVVKDASDQVVSTQVVDGTSVTVYNLLPGATYTWTVTSADENSASASFTTEDTVPRLIKSGTMRMVRDLGGWTGLQGKRIRYDQLFRGAPPNNSDDSARPQASRLDDAAIAFWRDQIGLKTEIDFRSSAEIDNAGVNGYFDFVTWKKLNIDYYTAYGPDDVGSGKGKNFLDTIRTIMNASERPVYFHCAYGRDRTGTIASIILGLLGVSEEDIVRDYQTTTIRNSSQVPTYYNSFSSFRTAVKAYGGATFAESVENYVLALGITKAEIEQFRTDMLVGYVTPVEPCEVALTSPANNATVALLTDAQKTYLYESSSDVRLSYMRYSNPATPPWGSLVYYSFTSFGSPVTLSWAGVVDDVTVVVTGNADQKTYLNTTVSGNSVQVYNLIPGESYTWTVSAPGAEAKSATFSTEATAPRLIKAGGIRALRDLGGWTGLQGKKVRFNQIFRGGPANVAFEDTTESQADRNAGVTRVDDLARAAFYDLIGMKTEIDLRRENELKGDYKFDMTSERLEYLNYDIDSYHLYTASELSDPANQYYTKGTAWVNTLRAIMNSAKRPVYFHCAWGRDRTGTVAALLELLLGVSYDDVYRDYQTTTKSSHEFGDTADYATIFTSHFNQFLAALNGTGYTGSTRAEKAKSYMLSIGFTSEEVEQFRTEMLDGYVTPIDPVDPVISGTITITGWTAGEMPNTPTGLTVVSPEEAKNALVYVYYADALCTQKLGSVPTTAGTYYVRGEIVAGGTWNAAVSAAAEFTIAKPTGGDEPPAGDTFFAKLGNDPRLVTESKYAEGGDYIFQVADKTNEFIHVFMNSAEAQNFVAKARLNANILLVGGGGAGGGNCGGGGGAGGFLYETGREIVPSVYEVVVGKGGAGGTGRGASGTDSTIALLGLDAVGGGGGGTWYNGNAGNVNDGLGGGSGGGASGKGNKGSAVNEAAQGNLGGYGYLTDTGGGGGGADAPGSTPTAATQGGAGGDGKECLILGWGQYFAGGGGGAGGSSCTAAADGGLGGGGAGTIFSKSSLPAMPGENGLGGGGGAGCGGSNVHSTTKKGASGGDGIVIIRYVALEEPSNKVIILEPTAVEGLVYDGTEKTGVSGGNGYTITGNVATEVGEYMATLALTDTEGSTWLDGSIDDKKISWSIQKATAVHTGEVELSDWMEGETPEPSGVTSTFGTVEYRYYLDESCTQPVGGVPTALGTYFVRAEVDGTANYNGAVSAALRVRIVKNYTRFDRPEGATFYDRLTNDTRKVASSPYATGGDIILRAGRKEYIHIFTNVTEAQSFVMKNKGMADIFLVGGGGAGGRNAGGGGGAGGVVYEMDVPMKGTYSVQVGAGGTTSSDNNTRSTNGGNSSIMNGETPLVAAAIGGGAGGGYNSGTTEQKNLVCPGSAGGSGGGAYKGSYAGGAGTAGQGFAGYGSNGSVTGGGGGALAAATSGAGGAGKSFYLLGYGETFAGGGGAGTSESTSSMFAGGAGGGGMGGFWNKAAVITAGAGEDGLGGGGGGGGGGANATDQNKLAGNGGDGIVIIRYHATSAGLVFIIK